MLLQEELNGKNENASAEILADIGVHQMSPELALKVIATRTDIIRVWEISELRFVKMGFIVQ